MSAYDELHSAADQLLKLIARYETAISIGDASTRSSVPTGDHSQPTGKLVEVATLVAARAYCRARQPYDGQYASSAERDRVIENDARETAARPEFRAAVNAVIQTVLVRQR